MTTDTNRPVCTYALAGFKRNSTKLLVTMCIGIALALYGVYVQARSQSNPGYIPTVSMATHWLYNNLGNKLAHPASMLNGCAKGKLKATWTNLLAQRFVQPVVHYSGLANGLINVVQIVLLKVYCRSLTATNVIIGLSAVGWLISMVCLVGAYASCKLMCISCLGLHHVVIIYYGICRRRIIKNMLCPSANTSEGACTFGSAASSKPNVVGAAQRVADSLRRRSGRP